jgi:hypothetical protein
MHSLQCQSWSVSQASKAVSIVVSDVCLAYILTLKMEAINSSETFLNIHQTPQCKIPEDNSQYSNHFILRWHKPILRKWSSVPLYTKCSISCLKRPYALAECDVIKRILVFPLKSLIQNFWNLKPHIFHLGHISGANFAEPICHGFRFQPYQK